MDFSRLCQSRRAIVAVLLQALTSGNVAFASQGPGGGPGTASPTAQFVVAIVVYGGLAGIFAAGLIGSLKQRR